MKLRLGFIVFFLALLFTACTVERKMAMKFIKHKENKGAVLVVPPFALDMYNANKYNLDSLYIPENYPLDSVLFQHTKLLKQISDSLFVENYINSFILNLSNVGFQVYLPDELEAFENAQSPAYIFKFAQVELSEEISQYDISEEISEKSYSNSFEVYLVNLNSWFEFEARDTTWQKVFYTENAVADEVYSQVLIDETKKSPVLYYDIDSLYTEHIYQMATDVGKVYAGYFTDYLMNKYIEKHFPPNLKPTLFFHYDAEFKMLFPFEEGFQELSVSK